MRRWGSQYQTRSSTPPPERGSQRLVVTQRRGNHPLDGIREGGIIVEFDGHTIANATDYQEALASAKPDVTVDIVVLRNGKRVVLKITPVGR